MKKCARYLAVLCFSLLLSVLATQAQTIVSGEIIGTVTDASGAVIPAATVTLASSDTGFNSTQTTGDTGSFRFSLLKPGNYTLTVAAPRFSTYKANVVAQTGQETAIAAQLALGAATETVEVTTAAPLIQTANANLSTTVSSQMADTIPNPGQDITNLALTATGVSVSTGAGYGNFSANGLGGTSNLFTVNGADYNDPSNNLANTGASNMALGTNELQEATVVLNGYTGEYGRAAGANLNYSTKSGTNQFHGNAVWYWNGTKLNAGDWFSAGQPKGHAVSNQWAASIGGPVIKNKLFFFFNTEGSRYVLPGGGGTIYVPTSAFATAVQNHLTAIAAPAAVQSLYTKAFSIYAGSPGIASATPISAAKDAKLGCGDFSGTVSGGTLFGTGGTACARSFQSNVNGLNTERLLAATVDLVATPVDALKFRWKQDRGIQATATDPINSAFSANSVQPEWDAQVNWTHTLNSTMVNQLIVSGVHYSAVFGPPNISAALAVFPTSILFSDGAPFTTMGGGIPGHELFNYPQGRRVGWYQIVDDFSIAKGNHGIKFGVNFRRVNLSDLSAGVLTNGEVVENSLTDFYNGVVSLTAGHTGTSTFTQAFASVNDVPEKNYSLGAYFQDEWKASSHLSMTFAVRVDRASPAVCNSNCFTLPVTQFDDLNHSASIPYNQALALNSHSAMPHLEKAVFGPRIGFAWTPGSSNDLVVRGGIGIFSDLYPLNMVSRFFTAAPNVGTFTITPSAGNNNIWIANGAPNSVWTQAAASNTGFRNGFASGGTLTSIQAALAPVPFSPPVLFSIVNNFKNPKYMEWSLDVEKSFAGKTTATIGYVGNHGYDLALQNYGLNTACNPATSAVCSSGPYGSLPTSVPDSRFGRVNEITNNGHSNYDGLSFAVKQRVTKGLYGGATFTWSHSLDNISNGGFFQFNLTEGSTTGDSFRYQLNPYDPNKPGYGSSDYDFRHNFSGYYVWTTPRISEGMTDKLLGGWTVSQVFLVRGGEPFSVIDTAIRNSFTNGSSLTPLAVYLGGPKTCSAAAASTPCLSAANFATSTTQQNYHGSQFGNLDRNSFRGPGFWDADLSLYKDFKVKESMTFTVGASAYNVFNHPNFSNPTTSLTSGSFGSIQQTVGPPNSPYGNFTGAIVNGRIVQTVAKFTF